MVKNSHFFCGYYMRILMHDRVCATPSMFGQQKKRLKTKYFSFILKFQKNSLLKVLDRKEVFNTSRLVFQSLDFEMQIVIVTNDGERRDFIKEVGEETLPEEYGGCAKLRAIQEVELAPLED